MEYKVLVTSKYIVEARHPLIAAKMVRDGKPAMSDQDLFVFGNSGAMIFRENGSTKGYAEALDVSSDERLDEIMAGWLKNDPFAER